MKNILIITILFLTIGIGLFTAVAPKAQAFDIEIPDICELIPALCNENPSITPSVDEVSPTAEITPIDEVTVTPTVEPTNTPSNDNGGKHEDKSDGRHTAPDGLGCAVHECKAIPNKPPNTGRGL